MRPASDRSGRAEVAPAGRGAVWEAVVREAAHDAPRSTLTGRGARTALTWGRARWVWPFVGLNLRSDEVHELYAGRSGLDGPFSGSVDVLAQDLLRLRRPAPDPALTAPVLQPRQVRRVAELEVAGEARLHEVAQWLEGWEWPLGDADRARRGTDVGWT